LDAQAVRNDIRIEEKTVHNFTLRGLHFGLRKMRPSPTSGIVRMKSINDMAGTSPTSDRRKIWRAFACFRIIRGQTSIFILFVAFRNDLLRQYLRAKFADYTDVKRTYFPTKHAKRHERYIDSKNLLMF
jgi:hypothetical protein